LEPLCEAHRSGLADAAADPGIWRWWPRDVVGTGWDVQFDWQLAEQAAGRWLLHTVFDCRDSEQGRIVGQTCYIDPRPMSGCVEIGGTWYAPQVQGTVINPACKLLMLGHAFACGAERVELKTDARNAASRAAMEKMGASFEGIFRRHLPLRDGAWRDSAWYSVIRPEWDVVRTGLEERVVRLTRAHG
jgi:RimJ/RimL family protein N-acetyltransferase